MEKNKSNNQAVCIICGILTVFGIVASIVSLANGSKGIWMVNDVVYLVLSVLVGYYAVSGHKKPHGNLLKHIILIYAASYLVPVYSNAQMGRPWWAVSQAVILGLCFYAAGRLNKVRQNMILMGIVTVIILYTLISALITIKPTIGIFTQLIIWIDICVAYFLRYKEHRLAGLMDKE